MDVLNLHRLTRQKYAKTGICTINVRDKKLFSLHVIDKHGHATSYITSTFQLCLESRKKMFAYFENDN